MNGGAGGHEIRWVPVVGLVFGIVLGLVGGFIEGCLLQLEQRRV